MELAQRDERVYATVGVHPNCLANAPEGWQVTIGRLARHPRVVAIGETGLDYHRDLSPRSVQAGALEWHCALAPTPLRGRRNEPAFVRLVAQRVASLRSMSIEEVEVLTTENARRVFPGLGKAEDE